MIANSRIERARRAADRFLESIQRAYLPPQQGAPAAFILLVCFIDYMGTLLSGKDSSEATFTAFMDRYIHHGDGAPIYKSRDIYRALRCKLVHNYALRDRSFYLTHGRPEVHLAATEQGGHVLNLETFFGHIADGHRRFFADADADEALQVTIARRIQRVGTLDDVQIVIA